MVYRRKNRSSHELRKFYKECIPVWNKQCVRCATVYSKFYKLCTECNFEEWLLEGEVDDVEVVRVSRRSKHQRPQYRPRLDTISDMRKKIQAEWKEKGDDRATQGREEWEVPRSIVRDTTIDLD